MPKTGISYLREVRAEIGRQQEWLNFLLKTNWNQWRKGWNGRCNGLLKNISSNTSIMERPKSNTFPRALLPVQWLTERDVRWLEILLSSTKIVKLKTPNYSHIHCEVPEDLDGMEDSTFVLECCIGFDTPTIQKQIYNMPTKIGELSFPICKIISEFIGSSMFSISITIKLGRKDDSWRRQKGRISLKYHQCGGLSELVGFDSSKGHFPTPRGGLKLVRWPDSNLLVDDYSIIGVIFHNRAVKTAMERVLVATVFCQIAHICCCKTSAPWSPVARNALRQLATVWKHWFVGLILNRHYNTWRARFENDCAWPRFSQEDQAYQIHRPNDAVDDTTDFTLDLPIRNVSATTEELNTRNWNSSNYDLPMEWKHFNKHHANHPCLWSSLSLLGWKWEDKRIFALWLNHPQWFDRSSGTSLCAAAHLLKPMGYHITITRNGETPDICWTLRDKRGHFEKTPIHHCPTTGKHWCFVIHQLPRAQNRSDETVTTWLSSSITTERTPRFFGSAKNWVSRMSKKASTNTSRSESFNPLSMCVIKSGASDVLSQTTPSSQQPPFPQQPPCISPLVRDSCSSSRRVPKTAAVPSKRGWAFNFTNIWDAKLTDTYDKIILIILLIAVLLGLVAFTNQSEVTEVTTTIDTYT